MRKLLKEKMAISYFTTYLTKAFLPLLGALFFSYFFLFLLTVFSKAKFLVKEKSLSLFLLSILVFFAQLVGTTLVFALSSFKSELKLEKKSIALKLLLQTIFIVGAFLVISLLLILCNLFLPYSVGLSLLILVGILFILINFFGLKSFLSQFVYNHLFLNLIAIFLTLTLSYFSSLYGLFIFEIAPLLTDTSGFWEFGPLFLAILWTSSATTVSLIAPLSIKLIERLSWFSKGNGKFAI